ncbi:MAG: ABC transporter substrate-binding protein, partial [Xanthobacteraceae bacterium]
MKTRIGLLAALWSIGLMTAVPARADINIGIILGTTGPTASAGLPYKSVFSNLPDTVAGQKVHYIMVDDAGDPTTTVKDGRKLIGEDKVDLLIGSTSTPTCLALVDV